MTGTVTPLDALCTVPFHEADEAARAAILRRFADTMIYVALDDDATPDRIELHRLPLPDGGEAALACDDEARLAALVGRPMMFASMAGRVLAQVLSGAGLSLLFNPGAPSQILLDAEALSWLAASLAQAAPPEALTVPGRTVSAPDPAMVAALAPALGERLADMAGMADRMSLLKTGDRHLILVGGTAEAAQAGVAKALAELLAFLPPLPMPVDVGFSDAAPPAVAVTLRLEAPPPPPPPAAKGPPRLR